MRIVWTDDKRAPVIELRRQGVAPKEIEERLGLTKGQVNGVLYDREAQAVDRSAWPVLPNRALTIAGMTDGASRERSRRVMALLDQGMSYVDIAAEVGVTKNTIAGIVHRARGRAPQPLPEPPPPPPKRDGCRWIDGHPCNPGWQFCCAPTLPGAAWCPAHRARVYQRER